MPFQSDSFDEQLGLSNAQLSERDAKHVKARLKIRQQQLRTIDVLLTRSKSQPSSPTSLLSDRFKILSVIDRYRISLAPYKKLPTELVQLIFQFLSTGDDPTAPNSPLVLCKVCSSWRQVAIATPSLWKSLRFKFTKEDELTPAQKVVLAKVWLSRAGRLPLSFAISDADNRCAAAGVNYVKDIIVPFAAKFQSLLLILPPAQVETFISLQDGLLSRLEDLYVGTSDTHSVQPPSETPFAITALQSSTQLRRFRTKLPSSLLSGSLMFSLLPFRSLETFRCDSDLSAEECLAILPSFMALKHLHVRLFHVVYALPLSPPITLSQLTSLTAILLDVEPYDAFLNSLVLPALKTLAILSYDAWSWSAPAYTSLLERSGCGLEELHCGSLGIQSRHIEPLLRQTPTLKSITFSPNTVIDSEVYDKIGRSEIGTKLEAIFLKGTRPVEPILEMLEERIRGLPQNEQSVLQFVEAHCQVEHMNEEQEEAFEARLANISDAGILLNLREKPESAFEL